MLRLVFALLMLCVPLTAGAQERRWDQKLPPVYTGGESYEYVSPGLLENEIAVVSTRYSAQVSELARKAHRSKDFAGYEVLRAIYEGTADPDSWPFLVCEDVEGDEARGRCLTEAIVKSDTVDIKFAMDPDHGASFVRPVFYENDADILELAEKGERGKLASLYSDVEVNDYCFRSSSGIKPTRPLTSMEPAIYTGDAEGCAGGKYGAVLMYIRMDRYVLFKYLARSRDRYQLYKELRYKGVGVRYDRPDGGTHNIYFSLLDVLDNL